MATITLAQQNNLVIAGETEGKNKAVTIAFTPSSSSFGPIITEIINWGISHRNHTKNRELRL